MNSPPDEAQREWVHRVLEFDAPMTDSVASGGPPEGALAKWQAARLDAVTSLRQLEAAVRKSGHPGRDRAIMSLRAVSANLTEAPTTVAKVNELLRYIGADDVVQAAEVPNVFGVRMALRVPLLAALKEMAEELAAGQGGGRA